MHRIKSIQFTDHILVIDLDGKRLTCNLNNVSPRLLSATESDRNNYIISPGGYGIHWPSLDEDLSINALLMTCSGNFH
ncbi:MAG: DUF2442 domain-containing protein [Flavobacteriales bacterium]